jgi:hypothetical protein
MGGQISTGQPAAPESVPVPRAQKSGQGIEKEIKKWLEECKAESVEIEPACGFAGYYLRGYDEKGEEVDTYVIEVIEGDYEAAFKTAERALIAKGYVFANNKFIKTQQPTTLK